MVYPGVTPHGARRPAIRPAVRPPFSHASLLRALALAGLYVLVARLGMEVATLPPGNLTLFWLPSGLGVGILALLGVRGLPLVWLASMAANLPVIPAGPGTHAVVAAVVSSALDALQSLAAWALWRWTEHHRGERLLSQPRHLARFLTVCLLPPLATVWALPMIHVALGTAPAMPAVEFLRQWALLTLGDAVGLFLVLPLASLFRPDARLSATLLPALCTLALFQLGVQVLHPLLAPLVLLGLALMAFAFQLPGAALGNLMVAVVIMAQTAGGGGPLAGTGHEAVFATNLTIMGVGAAVLYMALLQAEQRRISARLEDEVAARTSELQTRSRDLERSEADLRAILDNMLDVFYRADAAGRLEMISPSIRTMLGYEPEEMLGRVARDFYESPEDRDRFVAAIEANGGALTDYELRLCRKDGTPVWVSCGGRIRYDDKGNRLGIEGVIRLVEERRRVTEELRRKQDELQLIYDTSSVAIFFVDMRGVITHANRSMADMFGCPLEQLVGLEYVDLVHPLERESGRKKMLALMASHMTNVSLERHYLRRDGSEFWGHLSGQRMLDDDGTTLGLVGVISDNSKRKAAEEELARKSAELERSNRELAASNTELEQFAYVASHDLREPLRMVSNFLSLVERRLGEDINPEIKEFIGFARDGARRMDQLILDLLEYSRVGRLSHDLVPVNLGEVVGTALIALDPALHEAQASVHVAPDLPRVRGDRQELARLVQNLVGNAVKYRAKDRPLAVSITWIESEPGRARIDVTDNGIGIDPQYFERIFLIFQRLHSRETYEGTGIGLAVCKKIAERHGGKLWVQSEGADKGSTFSFTLPLV